MPALDICEPPIIRAFQKDGWQIDRKPYSIQLADRAVYADIKFSRGVNGARENIIVVEVKCFTNPDNDLNEFYKAVGQYQLYRSALKLADPTLPVYLALPSTAFNRISLEPAMMDVLKNAGVKLVVVDIDQEVIVSWTR